MDWRGEVMKKSISCCVLIAICLFMGTVLWALDNDVKEMPACKYCGMNREMFAHSRMLTEYDTGSKEGTCSLHCAAIDMALSLDKTPTSIKVGDYGTKKLIDAEKATWIIGGNKPGVMTKNAKWAFADKSDAEKFQQANGGRLATFDEALQAS
jgi:nitrous oxide reductase accessory protein NosL